MSTEFNNISFDLPKNQSNVIKVIGVGGGGSNAVNHMFSKGLKGVDFAVCNTDAQALHNSPVPTKIQLGATLTEGLGAGANPTIGEEAARESVQDLKNMLDRRSKMLFITVGMGGGTGTGAAPVIAKIAKELDILTVGIVTTPFSFEGKMRNDQAQKGIDKLREHVDSLVVINNNKLREVYGNLGFKAGFSKADEVLSTAATGIAQVITHHYTQNIDLRDAKTVLANSGTAIMGSGLASGSNRAQSAITKALDSPLLNDNKITGAQRVLLLIVSGTSEVTIDEIGEINDYIQSEARTNVDIIMGVGEDDNLGESIEVTVIATGFNPESQNVIASSETKKIIHTLVEDKKEKKPVIQKPVSPEKRYVLEEDTPVVEEDLRNIEVNYEEVKPYAPEVNEEDFIIKSVTPELETRKEEVKDIEQISDNQISFTFDLPIEEKTVKKREQNTEASVKNMNVYDIEEVKSEVKEEPKIRHNLAIEEEFAPELRVLNNIKGEKDNDEELGIKLKVTNENVVNEIKPDINAEESDASPLNLTIAELRKRADDRREKMKDFNYKFTNRLNSNIDDIESKPAYKRMGVDLNEVSHSSENHQEQSRITLDMDENDEIQFRSNNSFLHDNVD